jgi:hypothetical protein
MDKAIGFRRNIYLDWMEAAAAYAAAGDDAAALRAHLDPIVAQTVASTDNRRMALDILVNVWVKSSQRHRELHSAALRLYPATSPGERRWIHYGMTMAAYPFFHQTAQAVGHQVLTKDTFTTADIKHAMIGERGHLGALEKAVERVLFSLRNWGLLGAGSGRNTLAPICPRLVTADLPLQTWLLAVALTLHSGEELPYLDLIRLPELFPFAFTIGLDHLRRHPDFAIQRQGAGLDMVRLREGRR